MQILLFNLSNFTGICSFFQPSFRQVPAFEELRLTEEAKQ